MKMNRRFFLNVLETRFFVFLQNEKKRFFFVKGGRTRDGIPVVFFRCRCTVFLVPLTFLSLSLSLSFSHLRYFSSTVQWGIAEKSRELRKFIACATSPALLISAGLFFLFSFFYHLSPTSSSLPPPGIYFVSFRFCLFFFCIFRPRRFSLHRVHFSGRFSTELSRLWPDWLDVLFFVTTKETKKADRTKVTWLVFLRKTTSILRNASLKRVIMTQ